MEKRNIPKWLQNLQENSWELELLISGGAIFTLIQITDLFIAWLDTLRMISPILGTNIVFMSVLLTFKMLTFGFIAHLCLRAYWLSLVCINYVYPNGIKFNKIRREQPFKSKIDPEVDLQEQITNVDRYCGTVMYMSITSVFIIAGFLFGFVLLWILYLTYQKSFTPDDNFGSVIYSILIYAYVIYIIDFLFFGLLRKIKYMSYLVYPFFYFFDLISFRKGYQRSLWLFNTNINKLKLVFSLVLYISISGVGAFFSMRKQLKWANFWDKRDNMYNLSDNEYINHRHYMDQWSDKVFFYGVSSKIQQTNFMEVFIRYDKWHDFVLEEADEKKGNKNYVDFIKIKVDSININGLKWHPTIKKDEYRGITALIPIDQFNNGEHLLTIISPFVRNYDSDSLEIPFWIDRDNIDVNIK